MPGAERGSVVAEFAVAMPAVLLVLATALGAALVLRQRVIGAADTAALAAADAASGAMPGIPCALAERVAEANRAALSGCELDGLIATVTVSATFGAVPFSARSTAGPPP